MKFARRFRKIVAAVMVAVFLAPLATPAMAWKPKSHIYLADLAMRDATDDGKVTIYQADYAEGRIIAPLGQFEVRPEIVAALRANPGQYLAGVVGPDAYPDIMTGQQVIHPGTNLHLPGDPSRLQAPSAGGTDAWLTYLWRLAYAPLTPEQQRVRDAMDRMPLSVARTDTPEVRAFVAGYMTHAAGDMFMHTFVNHYAGGDFAFAPDPRNAVKHLVLEGYVGQRTPHLAASTTIEGVEDFIYRYMVRAAPGSVLEERLLRGGTTASVPAIFSTLRNGLQRDVDRYDRERLDRRGPSRTAYAVRYGPAAEYKKAWIEDIDRGLRAWPAVSHRISNAIVYNPTGEGADMAGAKAIATEYVIDHMLSMAGAPDALVATAVFIADVIGAILPDIMIAPIEELKKAMLDWLVREATGMSPEELEGYLTSPETHFDRVMGQPGGGHGGREATLTTLAEFNRDVLKIDDPAAMNMDRRFDPNSFAPAFNTVQMTKLMFLSEKGMADLLAALRAKGLTVPDMPKGVGYENAMLGFLTSMDGDNRWQGAPDGQGSSFFLARGGADAWRNLFMRQIGERADWPANSAPDEGPMAPPDDTGFVNIGLWAARVDGIRYDNAAGRTVAVEMTFRNDSTQELTMSNRLFKPVRALLNGRMNIPETRMEYVHADEAKLPPWHYAPHGVVPRKGRVSVRFVFDVGDAVQQRLVRSITIFEQTPGSPLTPTRTRDGASKDFPVDRLNLDGSVGAQAGPTVPEAVSDMDRLRTYEGRYRTNRGTLITLAVVGDELTGEAMTERAPSPREQVRLKLYADGSLRGPMRDSQGVRTTWFDLNIRFSPDGQRFAGQASYTHAAGEPPIAYSGERLQNTTTQKTSAASAPAQAPSPDRAGFVDTPYVAVRADAARDVTTNGVARTEVALTAMNFQGGRKSLQHSPYSYHLILEGGGERRWDGNYYGSSGAERLINTLWLEKDEQGRMTVVFPGAATAKPVRLSIRESGREVAALDLSDKPAERPAGDAEVEGGETPLGQAANLGRFEATVDKLQQDAAGLWEALVTLKNTSPTPERLLITDFVLVLYGRDGQARHPEGNMYDYGSAPRRVIASGVTAEPGGQIQLRLYFPNSAGMTPIRYRMRDKDGEPAGGPIGQ